MTTSPKNKTLLIIIGVLLVANIGTLCFFLLNRHHHKKEGFESKKNNIAMYLKNDIGFSELQIKQFDSLSTDHHKQVEVSFDEMRKEKEVRLKQLALQSFSDSGINAAVNNSVEKQKAIETEMLYHLKAIRELCTEEQRIKFDTGFYKVIIKKREERKKD